MDNEIIFLNKLKRNQKERLKRMKTKKMNDNVVIRFSDKKYSMDDGIDITAKRR